MNDSNRIRKPIKRNFRRTKSIDTVLENIKPELKFISQYNPYGSYSNGTPLQDGEEIPKYGWYKFIWSGWNQGWGPTYSGRIGNKIFIRQLHLKLLIKTCPCDKFPDMVRIVVTKDVRSNIYSNLEDTGPLDPPKYMWLNGEGTAGNVGTRDRLALFAFRDPTYYDSITTLVDETHVQNRKTLSGGTFTVTDAQTGDKQEFIPDTCPELIYKTYTLNINEMCHYESIAFWIQVHGYKVDDSQTTIQQFNWKLTYNDVG